MQLYVLVKMMDQHFANTEFRGAYWSTLENAQLSGDHKIFLLFQSDLLLKYCANQGENPFSSEHYLLQHKCAKGVKFHSREII